MAAAQLDSCIASEWLQCVFCGGEESEQILLLCFHPCCKRCLQVKGSDSHTLTCQRCSTVTVMGRGDLQTNFLKDMEQHSASLIEPKVCTICKPSGKLTMGTHICLDCEGAQFCQECIKTHGYIPSTRSHKPTPLSEMSMAQVKEAAKSLQPVPTCPEHHTEVRPQPLRLYCNPCQKALCELCWTESHQTRDHHVIKLSQLSLEKRELLCQETTALCEQVKSLEGIVLASRKEQEKNEEERQTLSNEVKCRTTALKQAIEDMSKSYLDKIDTFYKYQSAKLSEQNQDMEKAILKLKSSISFSETFQNSCSDESLVQYHSIVDNGLQHIKSEVEVAPKLFLKGSASLGTPARSITSLSIEDFIGLLQIDLPDRDNIAQAMQTGQGKVSTAWSSEIEHFQIIYGLDSSTGDILLVGSTSNDDACIYVYGEEGNKKENIPTEIKIAHNISVNADNIFVSDWSAGNVVEMDMSGKVKRKYEVNNSLGNIGVAAGKSGELYVTASSKNRLLKYSQGDNNPEEMELAKDYLSTPNFLCLTPKGHIAVSNNTSHAVHLFDIQCRLVSQYGGVQGSGDGQLSHPQGVCCDQLGYMYIADQDNHRVCLITPTGQFLNNVITKEHGIENPVCVAINPQGNLLAVGHSGNKLTVFKIQP